MKTLTNCADLTESRSRIFIPAYCLCFKSTGGFFSVSRLCTVNRVSESRFVSLLAGFSKPDMTMNIRSSSSAAY